MNIEDSPSRGIHDMALDNVPVVDARHNIWLKGQRRSVDALFGYRHLCCLCRGDDVWRAYALGVCEYRKLGDVRPPQEVLKHSETN